VGCGEKACAILFALSETKLQCKSDREAPKFYPSSLNFLPFLPLRNFVAKNFSTHMNLLSTEKISWKKIAKIASVNFLPAIQIAHPTQNHTERL